MYFVPYCMFNFLKNFNKTYRMLKKILVFISGMNFNWAKLSNNLRLGLEGKDCRKGRKDEVFMKYLGLLGFMVLFIP